MRHRPQTIAMIGNHLPRRCGIATFTADLAAAIERLPGASTCAVIAMNEPDRRYDYPSCVARQIVDDDVGSYRAAAEFVNSHEAAVVSLQHEYGIFGGEAGSLVLDLMRAVRKPIVTTLHTVLGAPNTAQREVMHEVLARSERVVVMSRHGAELLHTVHDVDKQKIDVIPHGIPEVPAAKERNASEIILTFGLLSPDKGIEYVIDALPRILAQRPKARYLVVGITHPHVKDHAGEAYREMLVARARTLGVESSVTFHDRFVSHDELVRFLAAADIYVTPYLNAEQITSGTLAYAVGSGKAVISTPYRYARELLDRGRGVLVPARDASSIAREVIDILSNDTRRFGLEQRAAAYGAGMGWPVVARAHLDSLALARAHQRPRASLTTREVAPRLPAELPRVELAHVRRMTDDTGILQHARFAVPRRDEGYCLDDNARALLLMMTLGDRTPERLALAPRYLAFVGHAFDGARFRNFMSYSRQWIDHPSPDDCHGRALWALGAVLGRSSDRTLTAFATSVFDEALPKTTSLGSPRAWAYALLGIAERARSHEDEPGVTPVLVEKLLACHRATSTSSWPWFEDGLTYCNARLAQALIVTGERVRDDEALETGLRALAWLSNIQSDTRTFSPIGSNGFWTRGGTRARFDQQPVEASSMISACLDAHRVTRDRRWLGLAQTAFGWFLGGNALGAPLYDAVSGGCRDGLHADRVNENQGAESTLSFLQALLEMHAARAAAQPHVARVENTAS